MPVSPGLPRWVAARLLLFSQLRVTPNSEICSMTTTAFRSSSLHMALGAVTLFLAASAGQAQIAPATPVAPAARGNS